MIQMKSKILALPIVLSLMLALVACGDSNKGAGAPTVQPVDVAVAKLTPQDTPLFTELPGRTVAWRVAEVRPQVTGIIQKRLFEEGGNVNAGDQLYQIDPATYEAAVQSARADLAKARANLRAVEAKASRYRELVKINAVSKQDYDDIVASLEQAKAQIMSAEAALQTASINLNYTKVYAPISGRIAQSNLTEGALATANQANPLTSITQLDPIYVDVRQSSSDLLRLRSAVSKGEIVQGVAQSAKVTLSLDGAGYVYPLEGDMQFSDVTVEESTGAVQVRAKFENPDKVLYPGMFVRARIEQGVREAAILAPQQAVFRQPNGSTWVWKISLDGTKATMIEVSIGQAIGAKWLILGGLAAGDQVVVEGLQKLRGKEVLIKIADSAAKSSGDAQPSSGDKQ